MCHSMKKQLRCFIAPLGRLLKRVDQYLCCSSSPVGDPTWIYTLFCTVFRLHRFVSDWADVLSQKYDSPVECLIYFLSFFSLRCFQCLALPSFVPACILCVKPLPHYLIPPSVLNLSLIV